ncbi:MAG TPA: HNH endonuclease [Blastocatellia bacterium]|nr:HNH endonuclease [Blastocatellia bacterium]
MTTSFEEDVSPGQQLHVLLKRMFPMDDGNDSSFAARIDYALRADGELVEIMYNSTINYMTRRLITTARYLKRKSEKEGASDRDFIYTLRRFLENELHIPGDKIELILVLLRECVRMSEKELTRKTIRRIRAQRRNCYICGIVLNRDEDQPYDSATVEHLWPQSIGGADKDYNLKLACKNCNESKASYVDASDYHYEEMCLISDKEDESFSADMSRVYEVAIWAKNGYKCTVCAKDAVYMGKLNFGRRNPRDSWHFLNIDAYCSRHLPE